jgi:hypothetical protein
MCSRYTSIRNCQPLQVLGDFPSFLLPLSPPISATPAPERCTTVRPHACETSSKPSSINWPNNTRYLHNSLMTHRLQRQQQQQQQLVRSAFISGCAAARWRLQSPSAVAFYLEHQSSRGSYVCSTDGIRARRLLGTTNGSVHE